jgi:predicted RNA-binding protein with RPS1 domain
LESGQQRHEELLQQLIHISANTNSRVIRLEDEVAEIKASQAMMLSIQQDQQKILERLSVRSISHEADIAELRRIK